MRRFLLLLAVCLPALADDHLVLRNGSDVTGTILNEEGDSLIIHVAKPEGDMTFPYKDILAINGISADEIVRARKMTDELAAGIERRTEMSFGGPVSRIIRTPPQVEEDLVAESKQVPLEIAQRRGLALRTLGLIPPDYNYEGESSGLHVAFSRAHFDRAKLNLWLVLDRRNAPSRSSESDWGPEWFLTGVGSSEQEYDILHELGHYAASQLVNFDAARKAASTNDDAALAFDAMWEGVADLVALEVIFERAGLDASRVPDARTAVAHTPHLNALPALAAPPAYKKMIFFPREYGVSFLATARRLHGWKVVRQVLSDPPVSTKQVLHPEKYFTERDVPVLVKLPGMILGIGTWEAVDENTLGELGAWQVLSKGNEPDTARKAAEGWEGDRYQVFKTKEGDVALAWLTVCDTEDHAKTFMAAAAKWLETRHPGSSGLMPTEERLVGKDKGVTFFAERKDVRVLVSDGFPSDSEVKLREGLWKSEVVRPGGGAETWIQSGEWKTATPGPSLTELLKVTSPATPTGQLGEKGFDCADQAFTLPASGEWQLSPPTEEEKKKGVFVKGKVRLEPATFDLRVDTLVKGASGALTFAAAAREECAMAAEKKEQIVSRSTTTVLGKPALVMVSIPNDPVEGKIYRVKQVLVSTGERILRFRFTAPDEVYSGLEPHLDRLLEGLLLK